MPARRLHLPHLFCMLSLLLVQTPGIIAHSAPLPIPDQPQDLSAPAAGGGANYLSITPGDFRPTMSNYSYETHGRYLIHFASDAANGYYLSPVLLPHGAVMTRFTLAFRDNMTANLEVKLYRGDSTGMQDEIASLDSSGSYPSPWYGSKMVAPSVSLNTIDNLDYSYFVSAAIPESTPGEAGPLVWFTGVVIEYQLPAAPANPGYFSMPVAGFTPFQDGYTFYNTGRFLYHNSGPYGATTNNGWYHARLTLPDVSSISSLTVYLSINSTSSGFARLQRSQLGYGNFEDIAVIYIAPGTQMDTDLTTTTISHGLVENAQYSYWLTLDIPPLDRPNSQIIPYFMVVKYYNADMYGPTVKVSIPAAAFNAYEDGYDYQNDARYLQHKHDPAGGENNGWYLAPVQLPQGARLIEAIFYWFDNSDLEAGMARLQRADLSGSYVDQVIMGTYGSLISGNFGKAYSTPINYPIIDNRYYTYYVVWDLPIPDVGMIMGCGVTLEYSFMLYMPKVAK